MRHAGPDSTQVLKRSLIWFVSVKRGQGGENGSKGVHGPEGFRKGGFRKKKKRRGKWFVDERGGGKLNLGLEFGRLIGERPQKKRGEGREENWGDGMVHQK